ncbi:hypothetical protein ABZ671_31945 [Micromonospora sp. NPDC006766]|uniref:hypothetical protein n=1 Tax=Micromonospora sp. NPDC006766 TaxID=3154778 RepID=UPI0033C56B72
MWLRQPSSRGSARLPSIDRFLADPAHTVSIRGTIDVDGIATRTEASGTLSLFPDSGDEAMVYNLRFHDDAALTSDR